MPHQLTNYTHLITTRCCPSPCIHTAARFARWLFEAYVRSRASPQGTTLLVPHPAIRWGDMPLAWFLHAPRERASDVTLRDCGVRLFAGVSGQCAAAAVPAPFWELLSLPLCV